MMKAAVISMDKYLRTLAKEIFSSQQKTIGFIILSILAIALPITITLTQSQSNSQSRAQVQGSQPYPATYPLGSDIKASYCNTPFTKLPDGFRRDRPWQGGSSCSCVGGTALASECGDAVARDFYYHKVWCDEADCNGSTVEKQGPIGVLFACRGWSDPTDSGYWVDLRKRVTHHLEETLPDIRNRLLDIGYRDADARARKTIWNRMIAEIKYGEHIQYPVDGQFSYPSGAYDMQDMSLQIFGRSLADQITFEQQKGCTITEGANLTDKVCYRNKGGNCTETECHDHLPANSPPNSGFKNPPYAYVCPADVVQVPFMVIPTPAPPNYDPEAVLSYCATPLVEIPPDFIKERTGDPPSGWNECNDLDGTAIDRECGDYYKYQFCEGESGVLGACRGTTNPIGSDVAVDGRKRIQLLMDDEGDYYPTLVNFFLNKGYHDAKARAKKAIWNRFASEVKYGNIKWEDGQTAIDFTSDRVWGDGLGPEYWPFPKVLQNEKDLGCAAPDPNYYTGWPNLCNRGSGPCSENECHDHLASNVETKNPPFAYVCPVGIVGGDKCGAGCSGPFVCEIEGGVISSNSLQTDVKFLEGEPGCYDSVNWYLDGEAKGSSPLGPAVYFQDLPSGSSHAVRALVYKSDGSQPPIECGTKSFQLPPEGQLPPATPTPDPDTGGSAGTCNVQVPDPSVCAIDSYCSSPLAEIPVDFIKDRADVPPNGTDCCNSGGSEAGSAVCDFCGAYYKWRLCAGDSGTWGACLGTSDPLTSEPWVSLRNRICVLMEMPSQSNSACNGRGQGFYDGVRQQFEARGYSDAADRAKKAVFNRIAAEIKYGKLEWGKEQDVKIDEIAQKVFGRTYSQQQAYESSKGCAAPQNPDYYTVWPNLCIRDRGPCGELECLDHRLNPVDETPMMAYICPSATACTGGSNTTTSNQQPGATFTPVPTQTLEVGGTAVELSLQVAGVGANESSGNQVVFTPSVDVTLQVFSKNTAALFIKQVYAQESSTDNGRLIKEVEGKINFDGKTFKGRINLGEDFKEGTYYFIVRLATTLSTRVPGEFTLRKDQTTALPNVILTSGDLNYDNSLTIDDWNVFVSCYGEKPCTQKSLADLNYDKKVNIIDGNILIRSYGAEQLTI